MKFGDDGRLYAINPEAGFFGVAPGTGDEDEPERDGDVRANTIFTNFALTDDGDVWWEGMTAEPPAHPIDWKGNDWTPDVRRARPRTRTRASPRRPRSARRSRRSGRTRHGVPIDAFLFGGRRATVVPLVHEAFDWEHGVFLGATMGSETTAAAAGDGRRAAPRPVRDAAVLRLPHGRLLRPLARASAARDGAKLPRIFYVNWFRKDPTTASSCGPASARTPRARVDLPPLRRRGRGASRRRSACVPTADALDLDGPRHLAPRTLDELLHVDPEEWKPELEPIRELLAKFGDKLPAEITRQLDALEERLRSS